MSYVTCCGVVVNLNYLPGLKFRFKKAKSKVRKKERLGPEDLRDILMFSNKSDYVDDLLKFDIPTYLLQVFIEGVNLSADSRVKLFLKYLEILEKRYGEKAENQPHNLLIIFFMDIENIRELCGYKKLSYQYAEDFFSKLTDYMNGQGREHSLYIARRSLF